MTHYGGRFATNQGANVNDIAQLSPAAQVAAIIAVAAVAIVFFIGIFGGFNRNG